MGHGSLIQDTVRVGSGRVRLLVGRVGSGPKKVTRIQLCAAYPALSEKPVVWYYTTLHRSSVSPSPGPTGAEGIGKVCICTVWMEVGTNLSSSIPAADTFTKRLVSLTTMTLNILRSCHVNARLNNSVLAGD